MRKAAILLLICALAVVAKPWKDKDKGKGQGNGRGQAKQARAAHRGGYYEFVPEHRSVVIDYYRSPSGLPPGLAKKGDLPPGLYKQLRRKGHLPPGLEKKMVAFPPYLLERLPAAPYGCERGFMGNIAIMWNPRTRIVFDFFAID
ncbi:MAG TPA: hypothetical protein VN428_04385 [Bryobacteraceae bacterium]|nr:hypothetical protein [Bryobacteraceae bacterium]